ncbi:MAG: putative Ig domain-containing protein [Candidatus Korobacteraceae bacterium]
MDGTSVFTASNVSSIATSISASAATHSLAIEAQDLGGASATIKDTITVSSPTATSSPVAPLQVTTTTLPIGTVGTSYSAALQAKGGTSPYKWTVVSGSMPSGLALSTSGSISGNPSSAGQGTFTLQAKDSAASPQAATVSMTITVNAPATAPLAITSASLAAATAGTAFSATLTACGGTQPYTWTLASGQLPSGMNLSAAGVISGTTSVTGTFPFTAEVTDATSASATTSLNLIVAAQSTTPGYTRWYAPTSFWNTPISASASIDPNSAGMVSTAISAYASGAVLDNDNAWGLSYVYATASSKVYTVVCTEYCNSSTTVFPIPAGTLPNTGSDGHLSVINGANEMDMWQASYNASTDTWKASEITTTTINGWGANCAEGQLCGGTDAAGFALLGGALRPEEIAAGAIQHALALTSPATRSGYIACPATHTDGQSSSSNAIPEGAQVQLDPSFNVAAQSWAPWQKTIAVALQQYGAFVNDTSGALALYAVNDINSGNTTWSSVGMTKAPSLSWIPWSQMRVLTLVKCGS